MNGKNCGSARSSKGYSSRGGASSHLACSKDRGKGMMSMTLFLLFLCQISSRIKKYNKIHLKQENPNYDFRSKDSMLPSLIGRESVFAACQRPWKSGSSK